MANQNVQEALQKFQDNRNKDYEKTQRWINELIGALNKHQSETENTKIRERNKIRTKIDNIKEEMTHDMRNLGKKEWNINTKHNRRPLQQIRTNRRQNFRTWRWNWN
jgi:hypothetical protein